MNGVTGALTLDTYRELVQVAGLKIDQLEETVEQLNKSLEEARGTISKLESQITELQSLVPVKPEAIDDQAMKILLELSRVESTTRDEISARISATQVLTKYHLEQLKERKLVREISGFGDHNYWALSKSGREFLFKQGLLT